jgi:hypothetical protein
MREYLYPRAGQFSAGFSHSDGITAGRDHCLDPPWPVGGSGPSGQRSVGRRYRESTETSRAAPSKLNVQLGAVEECSTRQISVSVYNVAQACSACPVLHSQTGQKGLPAFHEG